jgi:hypothetical protein
MNCRRTSSPNYILPNVGYSIKGTGRRYFFLKNFPRAGEVEKEKSSRLIK